MNWWLDNGDYGDPFNGFWENQKMTNGNDVYVGPKPPAHWTAETGPDVSDGLDSEGFKGGDQRHGHRPTTLESALRYLAEFIPADERRYQMDAIVSQLAHLGATSDCWKKVK
jgi:hypothetical protein